MSATETKQTHTPGALRAILALTKEMGRGKSKKVLAAIISRETGDAEMLEALELCAREIHPTYQDELSEQRRGSATKAWEAADAAIRKAKGEL